MPSNYYMPTWNNGNSYGYQGLQQNNNGITQVKAKEEALYYPIAPGNSLIFRKDDGSSIYIKTMSFSTVDPPIFEEYVRVIPEEKPTNTNVKYEEEITRLWNEINVLKAKQNNPQQINKNKDNGGN